MSKKELRVRRKGVGIAQPNMWFTEAMANAVDVRQRIVEGLRQAEFWPGPTTGSGESLPRGQLLSAIALNVTYLDRASLVALLWITNALVMPMRL